MYHVQSGFKASRFLGARKGSASLQSGRMSFRPWRSRTGLVVEGLGPTFWAHTALARFRVVLRVRVYLDLPFSVGPL